MGWDDEDDEADADDAGDDAQDRSGGTGDERAGGSTASARSRDRRPAGRAPGAAERRSGRKKR